MGILTYWCAGCIASSKEFKMNSIQDTVKNTMREHGLVPPATIITDGLLHRFDGSTGKSTGKVNCYYTAHIDGRAAGIIGNWATDMKVTWKADGNYPKLTDEDLRAFNIEKIKQETERKAEQAAKHKEAAQKAKSIWMKCPIAPADHPYLVKKRIASHGTKLGHGNTLIIPLYNLYNAKLELVNLQFINENGDKRFLAGGLKKGCFYFLGNKETDKVLIAEGFATAASLYEHTDHITIAAFDAGNLKDVAVNVKPLINRDVEIIICADNDESGIGEKKARDAALAVGGKYIIPKVVGHDFNDVLSTGAVA